VTAEYSDQLHILSQPKKVGNDGHAAAIYQALVCSMTVDDVTRWQREKKK